MILAAAVKFRIESTGMEAVLSGARHGDVFAQLAALGFAPKKGYRELAQGFIDHRGQFLDREEAFSHAAACGQLPASALGDPAGGLFSEDLW